MLKGLYFKLHDDNKKEKEIIDFFNDETKKLNISKIQLLRICIGLYYKAVHINITEIQMLEKEKIKHD